MQNPKRPSPGILAERKVQTVRFAITSPLKRAQDELEALRDSNGAAEAIKALEAQIETMNGEGRIPWEVSGTRLAYMNGVYGHQVRSLTEDLVNRFVVEKEPCFGVDVDLVSHDLCRSVAIVHTVIKSIDGGEPYNAEELLAMPFTALDDLWYELLGMGQAAAVGKATTGTTAVSP